MAVETFSTEAAGRLDGPEWLRTRRLSSAATALDSPLPTPEAEEWRYSRIAELDLSRYHLIEAGVAPSLSNGHLAGVDLSSDAASAGVTVGPPSSASALGLGDEPVDLFATYNDAFTAHPVVVDIPRGVDVAHPIAVVSHIDAEGAAIFPRLVVQAGENSSVQVIEVSFSSDVTAFVDWAAGQ